MLSGEFCLMSRSIRSPPFSRNRRRMSVLSLVLVLQTPRNFRFLFSLISLASPRIPPNSQKKSSCSDSGCFMRRSSQISSPSIFWFFAAWKIFFRKSFRLELWMGTKVFIWFKIKELIQKLQNLKFRGTIGANEKIYSKIMNPKKTWLQFNEFFHKNLFLVIIIILGGFWFLNEEDFTEVSRMESLGAPQAKIALMSRRGGIFPPSSSDFEPGATERKIIKNANLTIEVKNTEESKAATEKEINNVKGSITNLNSWETRPGVLAYNFTIRVPAEELENLMTKLSALGVKKAEGFNTQDITASYTDTENQIKNLEVRRDRLRELLEKETDSLKDIIEVERELSNVQAQIENHERNQKRRDINVAYSTLRLHLQPEPRIENFSGPEWTVTKSWKTAVNGFLQSLRTLVDLGMKTIALTPIWGGLILVIILIIWIKNLVCKTPKKKK